MAKNVTLAKRTEMNLDEKLLDAIGIQTIRSSSKPSARKDTASQDGYANKGSTKQASDIKFFIPDKSLFQPMEKPGRGDWLKEHKESGQTYKHFVSGSYRGPNPLRSTIYLLPLVFREDPVPPEVMSPLQQFASIFFGMPVTVLKPVCLRGKVADRLNGEVYQAHAGDILDKMRAHLKRDAFCVAGITLADLYPKEAWNFVFGLANMTTNCGVYSLARYLSNFGSHETTQIDLEQDSLRSILIRACKTMCHEIGHVFGLRHCIYFKCLMNGSNHLAESDSRPNFLCPVCLRKLHHACAFDIVERYQAMRKFWEDQGVPHLTEWLDRRLAGLGAA
ncbi:archaemetzincin-2-like isoform X2 [Mya arenaria]|uniref:archaemetzincin-2-like isoform X2 n=1 Tax=Mya arenaria TaxID=6604 RepID=UPI0022E7CA13|nr:archaemetzincin-2-like isoform X2 [Mya arenaria]